MTCFQRGQICTEFIHHFDDLVLKIFHKTRQSANGTEPTSLQQGNLSTFYSSQQLWAGTEDIENLYKSIVNAMAQ